MGFSTVVVIDCWGLQKLRTPRRHDFSKVEGEGLMELHIR